MNKFELEITYDAEHYSIDTDKRIEKAVGKECLGGGMGFGGRDLSFEFNSGKEMNDALARINDFSATNPELELRIEIF